MTQPTPNTVSEDAARYRWLRDHSCPPHQFYISVPDEFHGVRYSPVDVDVYIDEARAMLAQRKPLMTNPKHTNTSRSGDLVERLRAGDLCGLTLAAARIEALEAENERLRGELRFYAREQSWKSSGVYMSGKAQPTAAEIDRGDRARAALKGTEQ